MKQNPDRAVDAEVTGDAVFLGTDERDPRGLPEGVLNGARNLRFDKLIPGTRRGVYKPPWANVIDASASAHVSPWTSPVGYGIFQDPDGVEWQLVAADGRAWAATPFNQGTSLALPTGVALLGSCTFIQAFNKVYCFRGRELAPLIMRSFDTGFEDIVPHYDSTAHYDAAILATGQTADEIAYGPFIAVTSITRMSSTATVVTASAHGYITGADITIQGANQAGYNIRANIRVIDDVTFSYPVANTTVTPATGTIKCSNMIYYWKATGSVVTLTSLTNSTTTATATKTAHGFTVGQYVTIAGATPAAYNGTFPILTVADADHFTYLMATDPGGSASGTITARTSISLAGQNPDNSDAWARVYNILPNADNALYVNNRLLVPTAYEPASVDNYTTFSGGAYSKKDFIVAMDYLDDAHFDFSNEFRINQGSSDEIVDLGKFNDTTVIVWKGTSWAILSNVAFDLSNLTLDVRSLAYGLAARGAWALCGSNIYFLASQRGIVSFYMSEQAKVLSVDEPLSAPMQRTIGQINWALAATTARLAAWDSKLYVAVPTGASSAAGAPLSWTAVPDQGRVYIFGGMAGVRYRYEQGDGGETLELPEIDPDTGLLRLLHTSQDFTMPMTNYMILMHGSLSAPGTVTPLPATSNANNLMLVFDFVARLRGGGEEILGKGMGWCGTDTGAAICPLEFIKLHVNGNERLFYLGADGWVNEVETVDLDMVEDDLSDTGTGLTDIPFYALTRAYGNSMPGLARPLSGTAAIQTLNPSYSINLVYSGPFKTVALAEDVTRNPVKYFRPFDRPNWDSTNTGDDFDSEDREDYSAFIPDDGLWLGTNSVTLAMFQEYIAGFRVSGGAGRSFQLEVSNNTGRARMLAVRVASVPGPVHKGALR